MNQPLYQQIFHDLQQAIADGSLPVDSQVPTEKELSAKYQVSRITSKRALTELEQLGLIYRVRGKGSFVKATTSDLNRNDVIKNSRILFLLPFYLTFLSEILQRTKSSDARKSVRSHDDDC